MPSAPPLPTHTHPHTHPPYKTKNEPLVLEGSGKAPRYKIKNVLYSKATTAANPHPPPPPPNITGT